jgi:phage terminase large subunit-like protein
MANAKTTSNSFGEIKIDKEIQSARIDPIDAILDAHKVCIGYKKTVSVYEQRGMRSLS